MAGYPAYQCFKDTDRTVYCSQNKVNNHAEGNSWIARCRAHYNVQMSGAGYLAVNHPAGAVIYP